MRRPTSLIVEFWLTFGSVVISRYDEGIVNQVVRFASENLLEFGWARF